MNLTKPKLLLFSTILFLTSCNSMYMPNVPVSPMLTEKGEFHVGGHVSLKGNLNLNTALALTDNIAVIANGSIIDNNKPKKDFKQNFWEVGGGFFDTFGEKNKRIFEVFVGYGRGNSEKILKDLTYDGPIVTDRLESTYSKYFLQVNYSSKKNKDINIFGKKYPFNYGTILRFSHVKMIDFTKNGVEQLLEDNVLIEPVFFTRMELTKNLQLQYTNGTNIGLIKRDYLKAGNSVFTLGVVYNISSK